jgi:hypothetical protein
MPRPLAEKIAKAVGLQLTGPEQSIALYTPAIPQRREQADVLSQGTTMKLDAPVRAILLSDSCAVDSALAVEREARSAHGRLLFAPIMPAQPERLERLLATPVFGRFPLLSTGDFDGGVADLGRCFMVDVRAIDAGDRILGLADESAEALEIAWHAYALRRGPLATQDKLQKLASRLVSDDGDGSELVEMIEETLAVAWRLEGGSLRTALESAPLVPEQLDRLIADLAEIEQAAREARERLSSARLA